MDNRLFDKEYKVSVRDTDLFNLCRPSSLLNFCQVIAGEHAEAVGYNKKLSQGGRRAIWMLVRVRYELEKPIRGRDILKIRTYHRKTVGTFVYRDYEFYRNDELVGRCASCWVIADYETRNLMRPDEVFGKNPDTLYSAEEKIKLKKIPMPQDMPKVGSHRMGYSETDTNGHINNIRYADFACDAISFEKLGGKYIKMMQITYSAECLPGNSVDMLAKSDANAYYVRGVDGNGTSHFEVLIETDEIAE